MRWLAAMLVMMSLCAQAEESCVFDETAFKQFISEYAKGNNRSKISADGKTLWVNRNSEDLVVKGGGCDHLGLNIELITGELYTEERFLEKILDLSTEFGNWLINTPVLAESITKRDYVKMDGTYFIKIDDNAVFEASYDNTGKIRVNMYKN